MVSVARGWVKQMVVVLAVFTALGFATSVIVFAHAPGRWWGSALAALAAGLSGASGWAAVCGRLSRAPWWRILLAGVLGGILVHPYYGLLAGVILFRELLSPSDLLTGSLFSLLVAGVITVPAGILAALCCRALGSRRVGWHALEGRGNVGNRVA